MSSQSSHTTDSKNKNLLAAKASLGLSTAGSTSSSRRNEPTKSTSLHSVSSSVSGSTLHSNESSRRYPGSAQEEARRFSSNLSAASSSYRSNTPVKCTSLHSVSSSVSGGSSRKFPASAQEDAQRFTSSLHTDNDSYASSRYGQRLPTSQQIDETIEVGSVDDSMAGDSMIGSSSTYSTSSNKKSKRNNNATRDSDGNKKTSTLESNSSLFTSQSSTSEFSTSFDNCYEKKVDYKETSLRSIQEDAQSIEEAHPESGSDFYDSYAHSSQRSDFYDSNGDISERSELEDSNNNLSERSELDYSNANLSQRSDLYESNGDISQRSDSQSHMSRDDFIPQRFDEMRTLLSAITPLQLEALMQEIFGKDGPPGWRFIGKKSKAKGFRKDAYLSEMSIEELQNFARRMDNLGLDYCTSNEEALDVIAIEFERLVTLHQNKDEESIRADSMQPQNSMNSTMNSMMSSNLMEDEQMTLDSGRTSRSDEPDNLRRSLRACSFPELRLVAERLHLDHSSCVTKGELIYMIENSMPDLVDATSQDSQSQMLLEDYNNYSDTPRNSRDRRRKVKFSNDCKEDKSHLVSKRGSWQDNGQDIESSPLVKSAGDKESPRFIVAFKRVWKAVAVLLLLALIIGLSVGLTSGKGGNDKKGSSSDALMPQYDPFFGFGDFYGSSRTSEPSLSPSQQNTDDESQPTSHNQGKPSSPSSGIVIIKRDPTAKPSVFSTHEFYKGSHMPTETDTTQLPVAVQTIQPTLTPTIASLIETEKPIPVAQFSLTNDQPMTTDQPISTSQPTPLSPYPLLGPFEETDMRMVVYGISELSQMGKTQFKMLTAAYVEQFYNEEGRGTDAIQNIVFDVAASIDITSVDPPRRLTRSRNRALQTDILIITFTMNLSYKTFSNAVDAKTVAERPFLEESMIDDYIEFLDENNAQKFVGNIEDVSSIFRGDDYPEIYYDVGGEENVIDNTKAPSFSPVATPVKLTPRPTIENTPEPSRKPTAKPIAAVTPKPTLLVTPSPTERPVVSPTLSPTDQPTQSPTRKPTYKPTPGKVIHTYSPVKQVIHTYSPVAFRRMEEVQNSKES